MDVAVKTEVSPEQSVEVKSPKDNVAEVISPKGSLVSPPQGQKVQQQVVPQQKAKRKHRRGKPKAKNANKPYKKTNWKFQMPRLNYSKCGPGSGGGNRRQKLQRSRSLVPYNTNKFLMEEHLAEVPNALFTPSGRTRDSSFSMDSEDNYFFSLPEDEEEFLTKEFANVYEKARVERLENLSKQELIEECLQNEDRYTKDQGNQRQQQLNIQRVASEYMSKIRVLDEKVKELSRENHNLRSQLMRSAAFAAAAAASPPSAAAPIGAACQPTPMDSTSEDSESDSSSSSSSSSSASSSDHNDGGECEDQRRRRRSCSSRSSLSEYNGYVQNNYVHNSGAAGDELNLVASPPPVLGVNNENLDYERQQLLDYDHMEDDDDDGIVGDEEEEEHGRHGGNNMSPKAGNLTNGFHPEGSLTQSPPRANSSPSGEVIVNDLVGEGVRVRDIEEAIAGGDDIDNNDMAPVLLTAPPPSRP